MLAMTRLRVQIAVIVGVAFAALLALAAFSSTASADHDWNNYHWGRTSNPFTVQLNDNLSTAWDPYLATASSAGDNANDWSDSAEMDTRINPDQTNTKKCAPTSGIVEVCNSTYGRTGWVGLASIWTSGGHIVQGTAKMNDTYFNTSQYNNPAWKQFVMCQEVGHTFGLGHVNEKFDDNNTGSCMDYTNDPDGTAGSSPETDNRDPNQHDYDLLKTLYTHTAGDPTTVGSTSAASKLPAAARAIDPSDPSQRGRQVHRSPGGQVEIYERDFGGGHKVITRVIRATDGIPTLEKTNGGGSNHNHDDHDH